MPIKPITAFTIILLALAGCEAGPPVVTAFNESSVEIRQDISMGPGSPRDPAVIAEANRICATANRRAEYASTRNVSTGQYTAEAVHLFLCLRR